MKKFYKIVTLFATLALVACSKAENSEAPASQEDSTPAVATWETDGSYHWHVAADGSKTDKAKHVFEKVEAECVDPTCDTAGVKVEVCNICSYKKTTPIDPLGHDFSGEGTAEADVTGCAPTKVVKCKNCDKVAVRWDALDYDESLTNDVEKGSGSNAGSVRLKTAQDETTTGSKLVYKINIPSEASNVSFAMNAVLKYGDGAPAPVFDYVSGDQQQGYVQNDAGEWVLTTKRYQLKINGVVAPLGQDSYGSDITGVAGEPHWYDWPVSFNLNAGVNTVEILCLGGYRAYLFDFQFTGLPARA